MDEIRRGINTCGVVAADLVALVLLRPNWAALVDDLRAPHDWVTRVGADGAATALAQAAMWCVACWLALGLTLAAGSVLPGACGRVTHRLARHVLPALVWRTVAGAAGLAVLAAPVAAGANTPSPGTTPAPPGPIATAPSWPTDGAALPSIQVDWPSSPPTPTASAPPRTAPKLPAIATTRPPAVPSTPAVTPSATAPPPSTPTAVPTTPTAPTLAVPTPAVPTPAVPTAPPPVRPPTTDGDVSRVTVRPGDSLWLIAARPLGPTASDAQIAAAWPRWYAVNRDRIGPDPAEISPGQILDVPDPSPSD